MGDACQGPSPHRTPRLAADPITLKDKCPQSPKAPCGTADRAGGMAGVKAWEAGCVQEVRTEPPAPRPRAPAPAGLSQAFKDCSTYPARPSLGMAAGDHGADREWAQGVGGSQAPRGGSKRAVAVARWEEGTAVRCQQQCLCPGGRGRVGRGPGGYKYPRTSKARHLSRLRT